MADGAIISVRGLERSFGATQAVRGVTFDVPAGQVVGFIGANGAGKTTTMRLMATLDEPDWGTIRIAGFDVVEPETKVDSQRLFSKLRYQRQISPRLDWFANFDAARDEPSNINRQFVLAGGLGTTWVKTDRLTFRTAYGLSYTDEDLVVEGANRFAGYRLYYGLKSKLTETTAIESELTFDGSFETGDDVRTDWLNAIAVAINTRMALKSSFRVLFRNLPALEALDLRTPDGVLVGSVDVAKKKVDTNLTTSLVITF